MIPASFKLCKGPACRSLRAHMSDLLDGELDAARQARARAHLRKCPHCLREFMEFKALVKTSRELPKIGLSRACHKKLRLAFKNWVSSNH